MSLGQSFAKEQYKGQGEARARAIIQGKLPPVRRAPPPKPSIFRPVEHAAVDANGQDRASTSGDVSEHFQSPESIFHDQVATFSYGEIGIAVPSEDEILAFERVQPSLDSLNTQAFELRARRKKEHLSLDFANEIQFRKLVQDTALQADAELNKTYLLKPRSAWAEKQRRHLTKRQVDSAIRLSEQQFIREMPVLQGIQALTRPSRNVRPPPPQRRPTNDPLAPAPERAPKPAQPAPPMPPPVAPDDVLPKNEGEFQRMPEAKRYQVAKWLHSERSNAFWNSLWNERDAEALWEAYNRSTQLRDFVIREVESKMTIDPRRRTTR